MLELRIKLENGIITDEERRLLKELEDEFWAKKKKELDMLREKLKNGGKLTDEEIERLR